MSILRRSSLKGILRTAEAMPPSGYWSSADWAQRGTLGRSSELRKLNFARQLGLVERHGAGSGTLYNRVPNYTEMVANVWANFPASAQQVNIEDLTTSRALVPVDPEELVKLMAQPEPEQPLATVKLYKAHVEISHGDFANMLGGAA